MALRKKPNFIIFSDSTMQQRIEKLKKELEAIFTALSKPNLATQPQKMEALAKRSAEISEIVQLYENYLATKKEIKATETLLTDPELAREANLELTALAKKKAETKKQLTQKLNPHTEQKSRSVIMEIRAGAGGEEASLFASDLFRMYSRYAENKGWKINLLNSNRTGVGGLREVILEINGQDAFRALQYESGVHRVQRIPATEKSGRIHTSTVSLAVLPQAEDIEVEIRPEELRIDVFRSSGPGGQSVNTTDSAVRITHLPTGIVVSCQDQKSQLKNREKALKVLRSRLLEKKQEEEIEARGEERRSQIGQAKRAEKIRTYNFPQNRVTDHRIKKSWYGIERILDGEIDEIIKAVKNQAESKRKTEIS